MISVIVKSDNRKKYYLNNSLENDYNNRIQFIYKIGTGTEIITFCSNYSLSCKMEMTFGVVVGLGTHYYEDGYILTNSLHLK